MDLARTVEGLTSVYKQLPVVLMEIGLVNIEYKQN
jgi:hypothetical protein